MSPPQASAGAAVKRKIAATSGRARNRRRAIAGPPWRRGAGEQLRDVVRWPCDARARRRVPRRSSTLRAPPRRTSLCAMRRILLWMAGNRFLRDRLPKLWFARRAVRKFMPGERPESALDAGVQFQIEGLSTLYTRLGENLTRLEEADEVATHYLWLLDQIRERRLDGEISVKLTQLGFDLDVERTFQHASA